MEQREVEEKELLLKGVLEVSFVESLRSEVSVG